MTEDEKRGFQNGYRYALKVVEQVGYYFQKKRMYNISEAFIGFIDSAGQDVEMVTECYAEHGYEVLVSSIEHLEIEEKK